MKQIVGIIVLFFSQVGASAQFYEIIFDLEAVANIGINHGVQGAALSAIEGDFKEIRGHNENIALKLGQVYLSRDKLYESLKDVKAIKSNCRDIETISKIISDIGSYQQQMLEYASDDPILIAFVAKTELELLSKTLDLFSFVEVTLNSDDFNLMDNAQRLDLLKSIILDLRVMRGIAYSVCRIMKSAKRNGILYALVPGAFGFPDNGSKIKDEILKKYNSGRKK
jgi:hypothetical protein